MDILGVRIDPLTKEETLLRIEAMFKAGQHVIATPNPEIIMAAHRDTDYRNLLNRADLSVPDGAGILFISRLRGKPVPERITGTDLVPEIVRIAAEHALRIALIGGRDEVSVKAAADAIQERFPGVHVCFAAYGVPAADWNNEARHEKMIAELHEAVPDVVFVAFGHPKQEQWIDRYRAMLPTVKIFMGVGGALDFIAGSARRAPKIIQRLWLEWLWRLVTEPRRIGRIFTAAVIFPLTALHESFFKKSES